MENDFEKQNNNVIEDPFAKSLAKMKTRNIAESQTVKKRYGTKLLWLVSLVTCLAVFVYCFSSVLKSALGYIESDELYDSVAQIWENGHLDFDQGNGSGAAKDKLLYTTPSYVDAQSGIPGVSVNPDDKVSDALLQVRMYLNALRIQNPDLVGWIIVDGTNISYPVVQAKNNDYYLDRGFDGKYSGSGAIFMDYRNHVKLSYNQNTVIYGHNMNSGAMFHQLSKFFNKSFFKENGTVRILTDDGVYVYEIYSVSEVKATFNYIQTYFSTDEEFMELVGELVKKSKYQNEPYEFDKDDKLLTLSTCTNAHNNAYRYCISAYLVEIQR